MNHRNFLVPVKKKVRLQDYDPDATGDFADEADAQQSIERDTEALAKYQDILMAHETYGLLLIFQGMDGAGKDGAVKRVMSRLDPQGCEVKMFKKMTEKELRHDYLWRAAQAVPARGQVGIFNRSYYENVISERLHPEQLEEQFLPKEAKGRGIWQRRYREINNFEQYLNDNGIHIIKFYLHISKEKQRERLLERTEAPDKLWKFSANDMEAHERFREYVRIYEDIFQHTSTRQAPWYIVPANERWYASAVVASITVAKLKSFHARYPTPKAEEKREMAKARKALKAEIKEK